MHKNLYTYLLISSAFTFLAPLTYASDAAAAALISANSINSAASFFAEAKKSGAKLDQLFQQTTPEAKDEIARAVQDPKATAESLGVSAMLFSKLKTNLAINSHTPAASTTTTVGALTADRLAMQQNTVGAAIGEHRISREIGKVDKSPFTKAEQEAALEAERRAKEQRQQEIKKHFDAEFANLQRAETEARGSLENHATQVGSSMAQNNALQIAEITGRVDNAAAENAARDSLQRDFVSTKQQLGLQSSESANRDAVAAPEAVERNNLQAAFAQGTLHANESENRNSAKLLEETTRQQLAEAYTESRANALAAAERHELQATETAQRTTEVAHQEATVRSKLEAARDQSLRTAHAAEEQRKFEAKIAATQSAEVKSREALTAAELQARAEIAKQFGAAKLTLEQQLRDASERLRVLEQQRAAQEQTATSELIRKEIANVTEMQSKTQQTVDSMRTAATMLAEDLGVEKLDRLSTEEIIQQISVWPTADRALRNIMLANIKQQYKLAMEEVASFARRIDNLSSQLKQ